MHNRRGRLLGHGAEECTPPTEAGVMQR